MIKRLLSIGLISIWLFGCITNENTSESVLSKGVWKSITTDLDGADSVQIMSTLYSEQNGKTDFRTGYYRKDGTGAYTKLFDFIRYTGSHSLKGDSIIIIITTMQDTCCNVMTSLNIEEMPLKTIEDARKRSATPIRNVTLKSFDVLLDRNTSLEWVTYTKI